MYEDNHYYRALVMTILGRYLIGIFCHNVISTSDFTHSLDGSSRIFKGEPANPFDYPFMVNIYKRDRQVCGGAILDEKHVLTSGHCFKLSQSALYSVVIGDSVTEHQDFQETQHHIDSVIIHPNFTMPAPGKPLPPTFPNYDLAIVRIDHNDVIKFNKFVTKAKLPTETNQSYFGKATFFAFGKQSYDWILQRNLRKVQFYIQDQCSPYDKKYVICAGRLKSASCQGDSGSPLICKGGYYCGLLSGGTSKCYNLSVPALSAFAR